MKAKLIFRKDINATRALAVMLVLIYHIWPGVLSGGYVGVDVFFVISGFLITSHLLRELEESGKIRLRSFFKRRIIRLFPAAFCVLVCCLLLLSTTEVIKKPWVTYEQLITSVLNVQNWRLINDSVNYLTAESPPTLVQHFWSLSIEWQLYIAWPFLMSLAIILPLRHKSKNSLYNSGLLFLVTVVISILYSVYAVEQKDKHEAYFSLFTRVWEFGVGAYCAFTVLATPFSQCFANRSCTKFFPVLGVILIIMSSYVYSATTSFPGYAALVPVLGVAMLLLVNNTEQNDHNSFVSNAVVQFLGRISYSLYLWHWPILIVYSELYMHESETMSLLDGVLVLCTSIFCAWISYLLFELRTKKLHSLKFEVIIFGTVGLSLIFILCVFCLKNMTKVDKEILPFQSVSVVQTKISKTLARDEWLATDLQEGKNAQVTEWVEDSCNTVFLKDFINEKSCIYGNENAEKTLVLLGDSWATHFLPAFRHALSANWKIVVLTVSQCPLALVDVIEWGKTVVFQECNEHKLAVFEWLALNTPDAVVVSDSAHSTFKRLKSGNKGQKAIEEIRRGLVDSYTRLSALDTLLIHIESPPRANCTSRTLSPKLCEQDVYTQFQRSIGEMKINVASGFGFRVIDTLLWSCSEDLLCPYQIEGSLVKADNGHFSRNYSKKISFLLARELENIDVK